MRLSRLNLALPADVTTLQATLDASPSYFIRSGGRPAAPEEAENELAGLPPGKSFVDKFFYALSVGDQTIGCADVIRGYPTPEKAFIGLLLLTDPWQGKGFGTRAYQAIEASFADWPEVTTVRLAVVATNGGAVQFWEKMGFFRTGEENPHKIGDRHTTAILMERQLP